MRTFLVVAAGAMTMALTACGGGDEAGQTDLEVNNLVVDDLGTANEADLNMTGDMNATVDTNATENAVEQDLTTNEPDTNVANGY